MNPEKHIRILALSPFWRYAVGPSSGHSPAIPYYRFAPAKAFFEETRRKLPWAGVVLYRRRWFRGVEIVWEYTPPENPPVESPPTVNLTNRLPHPPLPSRPPVWPAVVMALIVAAGLLLALVLLSGCHSPQLPPVGPIPDLPAFDSLREASKPATLVEP